MEVLREIPSYSEITIKQELFIKLKRQVWINSVFQVTFL